MNSIAATATLPDLASDLAPANRRQDPHVGHGDGLLGDVRPASLTSGTIRRRPFGVNGAFGCWLLA